MEGPNLPYDVLNACAVGTEDGVIVVGDFGKGADTNMYLLVNGSYWRPLEVNASYFLFMK